MTYETPDQYELRTMPEAFHKQQGQGSIGCWHATFERTPEYYETCKEYEAEETRKALLSAEIDRLVYQCRKHPELDAELTTKIMELENQLNNFHLLPKHILC